MFLFLSRLLNSEKNAQGYITIVKNITANNEN